MWGPWLLLGGVGCVGQCGDGRVGVLGASCASLDVALLENPGGMWPRLSAGLGSAVGEGGWPWMVLLLSLPLVPQGA